MLQPCTHLESAAVVSHDHRIQRRPACLGLGQNADLDENALDALAAPGELSWLGLGSGGICMGGGKERNKLRHSAQVRKRGRNQGEGKERGRERGGTLALCEQDKGRHFAGLPLPTGMNSGWGEEREGWDIWARAAM
jgi:hypothetical protein